MKRAKRFLCMLLTLCLTLGAVPTAVFATETSEIPSLSGTCGSDGDGSNLTWAIDPSNNSLTISGQGAMADYLLLEDGSAQRGDFSNAPWFLYDWSYFYSEFESIDQIIINENVTYIGDYAFYSDNNGEYAESIFFCGDAPEVGTRITLPNTSHYDEETKDYIEKEVTFYYVEGTSGWTDSTAYDAEAGTWNGYKLETWNGKAALETISGYCGAEGDGSNLTWTLTDGVLTISGTGAMQDFVGSSAPWISYAPDIHTLVLNEGITHIGNFAFSMAEYGFTGNLVIPSTVTSIGNYTFSNCTFTGTLTLPNTLTSIGDYAFRGCTGFTGPLIIPASVTTIGVDAFSDCFTGAYFYGDPYRLSQTCIIEPVDAIPPSVPFYYLEENTSWTSDPGYDPETGTICFIGYLGHKLEIWNREENDTPSLARLIGTSPADGETVDAESAMSFYLRYDREVSDDTKSYYADLDFTKAPFSIYRESDNALVYKAEEWISDFGSNPGTSVDIQVPYSDPTYVKISITNGHLLFDDNETYYITMGEGFIKFADGSVGPAIEEDQWVFSTKPYYPDTNKTVFFKISTGDGTATVSVEWDDSWFDSAATTYNHKLARAAMALSGAAYVDLSSTNIEDALQKLDFDYLDANYKKPTKDENDIVSYTFGSKPVYDDDEGKLYTLVTIAIKGTSGNEEWYSNFNVGNARNHVGFYLAKEDLMEDLRAYISEHNLTKESTKYLVTGHSRGAAVANLVAAELTNAGYASNSNIFGYTFATPTVSLNAKETGYKNIFNICSGEDFVTRVPLSDWGYKRYGIDLLLPSRSYYGEEYDTVLNKMNTRFLTLTGVPFEPYDAGTIAVDAVVFNVNGLAPSTQKFYDYSHLLYPLKFATTHEYFTILADFLATGSDSALKNLIASELGGFSSITNFFLVNHKFSPKVFSAHGMAGYYSWLSSCTAEELFGDSNERTCKIFKRLTVACPVDVYVYNAKGNLEASVVNESIGANTLAINVEEGVKTIDIPNDQQYSIEIVATDVGTMTYTINECSTDASSTTTLRTVLFNNISLDNGDAFEGNINCELNTPSKNYALTKNGDTIINADYDSQAPDDSDNSGNDYSAPTYSPVIEQSTGGDISVDNKHAEKGKTVTITPTPDTGYEIGSVIVTDKNGNEIEVTDNEDGTFSYKQPYGKVTIDVTFTLIDVSFTDVNENDWFFDAVEYVYRNKLMAGTSDTTFSPAMNTTRGMIVTILHKMEGSPSAESAFFQDVPSKQYYAQAVNWAAANGIVAGYDPQTFGPNDPITREQMASILYRYAQYKGYDVSVGEDTNILSYADIDQLSEWAIPAMQWACGEGLISGMGNGMLAPKDSATRAQIATILMQFCHNVAK